MNRREAARLFANPRVVLVLRPGIDHQHVVVLAQPVHQDVVDKRALRREQRRIVRLPVLQPRSVVHGNVLHGSQRARTAKLNLTHVAHVEQAHAGTHRHVLGNKAASWTWVFNRHVPPPKVDHLGLEGAVRGVESGSLQRGGRPFGLRHGSSFPPLPFSR